METVTIEVGPRPRVRLSAMAGDLRLTAREGTTLEAQASPRGGLSVTPAGEWFEVACQSACLIFLPRGASVEGQAIGGDARITGLEGSLGLGTVGGDLHLRRVGPIKVDRVGGELSAQRVDGDLEVGWVGGDAIVDRVGGSVRLEALGGDLRLSGVEGTIQAHTGGDGRIELSPPAGSSSVVQTGGDLTCRVPDGTALELRVRAGGEFEASIPGTREQSDEGWIIRMDGAHATAELTAGGDLWVYRESARAGVGGVEGLGEDLRMQVEAQVDEAIAQVEASLGSLGSVHGFDAERISERIRRSAERAQRRAERARARADRARVQWSANVDFGPWTGHKAKVDDKERLAVLQMLEQKVISVEEAEKLLRALEGQS